MRHLASLATLALIPVLALGQQFSEITGLNFTSLPVCAQTCLTANSGQAPGCSVSDFGCFCRSTNFIDALSCCLQQSCNATDQKSSLAFEVALCGTYNVTIPNFLGCSPLDSVSTSAETVSGWTLPTSIWTATTQTATTISSYIPAYTTKSGGSVNTNFAGSAILTGSCTTAAFASYTMANSGIMQFPFIGCSNQNPGCCPFDAADPGPLTQCPHDYYTTSSACCPNGWTIAPSAVAGQTYCATSPIFNVVPASSATGAGATAIATQIYSLRYDLGSAKHGLSSGAIAGIAVGAVAVVLLIALASFLLMRARRRRAQKLQATNAAINAHAELSAAGLKGAPTDAQMHALPLPISQSQQQISEFPETSEAPRTELPSPAPKSPPGVYGSPGSYASSQQAVYGVSSPGSPTTATGFVVPGSPALYPQELPGSSHMHEHHPAFSPPRTPVTAGSPMGSPERSLSGTPVGLNPLGSHPHREDEVEGSGRGLGIAE